MGYSSGFCLKKVRVLVDTFQLSLMPVYCMYVSSVKLWIIAVCIVYIVGVSGVCLFYRSGFHIVADAAIFWIHQDRLRSAAEGN
jgi:hypothetical protein